MPAHVVRKVADALNDRGRAVKGSKVLLLGMAYKKDVDDPRESPGFELMDLLLEKGAEVEYNDPHIPTLPTMRKYPHLKRESRPLSVEALGSQDCVLIVTDHSALRLALDRRAFAAWSSTPGTRPEGSKGGGRAGSSGPESGQFAAGSSVILYEGPNHRA